MTEEYFIWAVQTYNGWMGVQRQVLTDVFALPAKASEQAIRKNLQALVEKHSPYFHWEYSSATKMWRVIWQAEKTNVEG